jgi:hypothetical protein
MKYKYFISYAHQHGFGNSFTEINCIIDSYEVISIIEKQIASEQNISGVVITNFILLSTSESEATL